MSIPVSGDMTPNTTLQPTSYSGLRPLQPSAELVRWSAGVDERVLSGAKRRPSLRSSDTASPLARLGLRALRALHPRAGAAQLRPLAQQQC